jgi:hypothetical protein
VIPAPVAEIAAARVLPADNGVDELRHTESAWKLRPLAFEVDLGIASEWDFDRVIVAMAT